MRECFYDKNILVIGGTGTIGKALVKRLLEYCAKVVRIFSRDEYKQFIFRNELEDKKNVRFLLGDVREKERLNRAMQGIDIVFNLAALKHVPSSEYNPFEAVKTNVMGVQNTIECAIYNNVKKVIYTSSDKAISPTNTMGATKLLAERLMTAADYSKGNADIVFSSVRFGNVIGSRGSVVPLFAKQIRNYGYVTITHPNMTRFMMTVNNAIDLLLQATKFAKGGEIFILKMPSLRIGDMAEVCIEESAECFNLNPRHIDRKIIGMRPGEKMFEELMTLEEAKQAVEFDNMYAVLSINDGKTHKAKKAEVKEYKSADEPLLNKDKIRELFGEEIKKYIKAGELQW